MDKVNLDSTVTNYSGNVAVVLGGAFVNALHVIRALGNEMPIIAINNEKDPGLYSKHVSQRLIIESFASKEQFLAILLDIGGQLNSKAVIFPTSDLYVKMLAESYGELSKHFHIPLNPDSVLSLISKEAQYKMCAEAGVPFPKSFFLKTGKDVENLLKNIDDLMFPLIAKPLNSIEGRSLFKVKTFHNKDDLLSVVELLSKNIDVGFIVSELIPGEPDNIWIYIGYCDSQSRVLAGWSARKLTQRPFYFGVFSTARYEKNSVVASQGRKLLESGKYVGIGEPEFKYDYRDKQYKLIEINPRYMMFHGVGVKGGINLPLIQYYHCIGDIEKLERQTVDQGDRQAHLVFMYFELLNILDHRPRIKFIKNAAVAVFRKNKVWGMFDLKDPYPFFVFLGMLISETTKPGFMKKMKSTILDLSSAKMKQK